jgi:hypothetical protein
MNYRENIDARGGTFNAVGRDQNNITTIGRQTVTINVLADSGQTIQAVAALRTQILPVAFGLDSQIHDSQSVLVGGLRSRTLFTVLVKDSREGPRGDVPNEDLMRQQIRDKTQPRKVTTHPTSIPNTLISINNHNRNDHHRLPKLDGSSHRPRFNLHNPRPGIRCLGRPSRRRDVVLNRLSPGCIEGAFVRQRLSMRQHLNEKIV